MPERKPTIPLTDDQLAAIAWGDPAETVAALAARIDAPYATVFQARRRFARDGWLCRLLITNCEICSAPLLCDAAHPRRVHLACERTRRAVRGRQRRAERRPGSLSTPFVRAWRERHPDATAMQRERQKARQRERWPDLPLETREDTLARAHAADERDQSLTRERATQSGAPWTAEEDAFILTHIDLPARDVALTLGRSLWAVRGRRVTLRRRDLLERASRAGGQRHYQQEKTQNDNEPELRGGLGWPRYRCCGMDRR